MQILGKTRIDFLGKQPITFTVSALLLAVAIWSLAGGINRGIDFAGGTEIQVLFAEPVAIDTLRDGLDDRGIDASLQRIGVEGNNEYLIRVGAEDSAGIAHAAERPAPVVLAAAQEPESGAEPPAPVESAGEADAASAQAVDTDNEAATGSEPTPVTMTPADSPGTPQPATVPEISDESERVYSAVLTALRQITGVGDETRLDLNVANEQEIASALRSSGLGASEAQRAALAAIAYRTDNNLFHSFDEVERLDGMTSEAVRSLEAASYLGPFTIRKVEFVGPRVGKELAEKAYLAMFFALAGMLVYITVRFRNLGYALGGIAALVHDGVISAGIFNLWGGQFDLTIVAALLTLLGYSINDTIVVFDRVRENMGTMRGKTVREIFNGSINQTLSRTLLTSLTTLLVVFCLYSFGGDTIHGFAFLLLFGILIGTYSTIFIASPVAILYQSWSDRRRPSARSRSAGEKAAPRGRAAS